MPGRISYQNPPFWFLIGRDWDVECTTRKPNPAFKSVQIINPFDGNC